MIILIENPAAEAADSRRSRPKRRRNASRSRRGLIDSLGALDHTGKAADGWQKILDHLNGTDPPIDPPSVEPDRAGTLAPSIIRIPTNPPTKATSSPTPSPTKLPTEGPTNPPTSAPTKSPTPSPIQVPTFTRTSRPTTAPTESTPSPTRSPSAPPTRSPTGTPTKKPTVEPTRAPTSDPTTKPTVMPTKTPTGRPTKIPTSMPTRKPTGTPTGAPTKSPTPGPMVIPSVDPQESPSPLPTDSPFTAPTKNPTHAPTWTPNSSPTSKPSKSPTRSPTKTPTGTPSSAPIDPSSPTGRPTISPSESPSAKPSLSLTAIPTKSPAPSASPSEEPSTSPSATGSPTLTAMPTKDNVSDSAVFCPGVESPSVSRLEVWWKYAVHFGENVNRTSAIMLLEMELATELEDEVLECPEGSDSRRLEREEGIVGIDYLPLDEPLEEACPGVTVNCVVYKGTVSLYLKDDGSVDGAIETTRKSIINIMSQNADEIIGDDISKIEYLSPDMQTAAAQGTPSGENVSRGESTSAPTVAIVSVGVVFAAIALTMGYRYKNRVDDAALSTIGPCGSQLTMTSSQLSGNTDGTSGLSTVMPSTYRLGESHCMDAILEGGGSSDTSSQTRNVSIIVSEGGYSEDDSRMLPRENYNMDDLSGEYLLGAQRPGSNYQMDQLQLSDSFSDIEPPYDSSMDDSLYIEHERTYTGQSNELGPSPLAFLAQDHSFDL